MINTGFPLYFLVFFISLLLTASIGRVLIPYLLKIKAAQPIYSEGPSWHISKSGTPTMGGICFLISIFAALLLSAFVLLINNDRYSALSVILCLSYGVLNSAVGIIDDLCKLKKKENKGLSAAEKLILQFLISALFLFSRYIILGEGGRLSFAFGTIDLGIWYYPLALIILVGITNCANLTDGVDGLASCVAFASGMAVFYMTCLLLTDVALIAASVMGGAMGFLIFNIHPAKVFMGDTGSLFFGSMMAAVSVSMKNPIVMIFIGGIYVIEGISVILQVFVFKLTGKRIFKMAPIHHHLEKSGWGEDKICITAIILTFVLSIPAYIFYLP